MAGLCLARLGFAGPQGDFYVSPQGDDRWSGTLAAPNAQGTDGPFASLARAQKAARELKQREPNRERSITVLVRGGLYFLDSPLILTPEDSGTREAPVVYAAYGDEKAIFSGGVRLSGFKVLPNGRWQIEIPEVRSGEWLFSQLFVNGQRRFRPRLPKVGYSIVTATVTPSEAAQGRGHDRFQFAEGDINPQWTNLADVEALIFHQWGMSRLRIGSVDETNRVVTLATPTCGNDWWAAMPKGHRYIMENVAEALETPGEWYLDRKTGVLTYLPLPGEDAAKAEVIAPRLGYLVSLRGDPAIGLAVENVIFRGLTFCHTNWNLPEQGYSFPQAEAALGAAIRAVGARDCALERCVIAHTGEYAVEWGTGCQRNRVEGCTLVDLGAGGVKIGEQGYREDERVAASHQLVRDNLIAHGGRMHPAAVGVWIGHSPYNVVAHNDINDFYYTAVSVGWQWSYAPSLAHHNIIEYNHLHNLGQGVLSDMGGIYTLGPSPGSVLRGNRIHDVDCFSYGGWGIYFDQATTEILAEGNICYRCETGGFHQHFGRDNRVINNIFAFAKSGQLIRTRAEDHLSFTFERNIVYWKEGSLLGGDWSGNNFRMDRNVYWDASGAPVTFLGMTFEQWQDKGQDQNSIIADPLFVDPEKDDFSLRPESPALKLGFEPTDPVKIGPQLPPLPAGLARPVPAAYPPPPPPPPPQPIDDGFELQRPGDKPADVQLFEENDQAVIRVTDEQAASGKHSLKFVDIAGQKVSYAPHMVYRGGFNEGVLEGSFDLRIGPGMVFYHEWRDWPAGGQYIVGPSMRIAGDGSLTVGGAAFGKVPQDKWVHFEIVCGLGEQAKGTYQLTVTWEGQGAPLVLTDLPCAPKFKAITWFGFVADGTEPGVAYLDNVKLKPRAE